MGGICGSSNQTIGKMNPVSNTYCKSCGKSNEKDKKSFFQCKTHDPLCESCELLSFNKKLCIFCTSTLKNTELKSFKQAVFTICAICKNFESSTFQVKCNCFLCLKCYDDCINSVEGRCKFCKKLVDEISLPPSPLQTQCDICCENFFRNQMRTLDCEHFFDDECLKQYLLPILNNRKVILSGIKCPKCEVLINYYIIKSVVPDKNFEMYDKTLVLAKYKIVECPNPGCNNSFETDSKQVICNVCKLLFCVNCLREYCVCVVDETSEILNQLEQKGAFFSCCPRCKYFYEKDDGCEHVECIQPRCGASFCYQCSAFRSPTMVHGCHYHRPQCRFYSKYDGDDDKFSQKCEMCVKKGSLCDKPKNLNVPRRFGPGEI